jgi:DHA2 family multidrug resistance protein
MRQGLSQHHSLLRCWLITLTVMLVAMMEALDMTVTNVALPHLMSAFDVSSNTISWIVTAYITASAVVMPIVGLLVAKVGRRRLLFISTIGFAAASFCCGMVNHFLPLVVFRAVQGLFGATLIPLSQCIIMDTFPKEECNKGLAVWAGGVMIAPILGPLVGGYFLAVLNWRWIFFINIPICAIAVALIYIFISESKLEKIKVDWSGFSLLILAAAFFQVVIDRGASLHWLQSRFVTYGILIVVCCTAMFIYRGIKLGASSVINFALFKTYHFTVATIITIVFSMNFMGINTIAPIFFQDFLNYPPLLSGLLNIPAGIAGLVGMGLAAALVKKIDARAVMLIGLIISVLSTLSLCKITLNVNMDWIMKVYMIRNFGLGFFFVPVLTIAMLDVPHDLHALASGVFNFARNIGGSIGISYATSQLNGSMQSSWNHLSGFFSPYQTGLDFWLANQEVMPNMTYNSPVAVGLYAQTISQQSYTQGFNTVFYSLTFLFVVVFILLFFVKKTKITTLNTGH